MPESLSLSCETLVSSHSELLPRIPDAGIPCIVRHRALLAPTSDCLLPSSFFFLLLILLTPHSSLCFAEYNTVGIP